MLGADISEWQGVWSPDQFAQYGFVIIRYGTGENPGGARPQPWEDKCWAGNWQNAYGRTIRGAYWYADPRRDPPEVQAQRFVTGVTSSGYSAADLPLMLDYEQDMGAGFDYRGWARAFLNTVEQQTQRTPLLYLSASRISGWLQSDQSFARYPLMVASYGPNDGQDHPIGSLPWPFTIHQYTSTPHDLNFADDNAIHALVGGDDLTPDQANQLAGLVLRVTDIENRMGKIDAIYNAIFDFKTASGLATINSRVVDVQTACGSILKAVGNLPPAPSVDAAAAQQEIKDAVAAVLQTVHS